MRTLLARAHTAIDHMHIQMLCARCYTRSYIRCPCSYHVRIQLFRAHTGTSPARGYVWKITFSWRIYLEYIFLLQGDSVLSSIVEAGVRQGLERCQKLFENDTWNCPVEMYKKLPIIANTALPYGKSIVFYLHCCVMCMIILRLLLVQHLQFI